MADLASQLGDGHAAQRQLGGQLAAALVDEPLELEPRRRRRRGVVREQRVEDLVAELGDVEVGHRAKPARWIGVAELVIQRSLERSVLAAVLLVVERS